MSIYILILVLFSVGLYGLLCKRSLMKEIISLNILGCAVNLFLITAGFSRGYYPPIMSAGEDAGGFILHSVDPLVQAMVLIVIGIELGVLLLLTAISLRLYHHYRTYDLNEIRRLRG